MPCFSIPNAATVLMAVNISSAIDPAIEYLSCSKQQALDAFCSTTYNIISFTRIHFHKTNANIIYNITKLRKAVMPMMNGPNRSKSPVK